LIVVVDIVFVLFKSVWIRSVSEMSDVNTPLTLSPHISHTLYISKQTKPNQILTTDLSKPELFIDSNLFEIQY